MSRSSAFASNMFWSLLLQAVTLVVGFLVPRSIIACYGSEVNGLVTSLTQFVSYISLVEAGISAAAVFALYKPLADRDGKGINIVVSAAKKFYYKSGWAFVGLMAILAFAYPLFVDVGSLSWLQVAVLVVSLSSMGILDFFTLAKYRVLLTASQRNWMVQLGTIVYRILNAAVIVALAHGGFPVEVVYVAAILPVVVRTIILSAYTRKVFPDVDFSADDRGFKLDQRWDAFFLQILGIVQNGAPIIIATFLLQNLTMVSVYSVYLLVANGVQSLCSAFSNGTQSSFGDVIVRHQSDVLQRTFKEFQTLVYTVNALFCGVAFVLIGSFIDLYTQGVADVSYDYPLIGFLVILNVFLYHLKTPQGLLVIAAGMYRDTRVQTSIQTVVLIVGSLVLGAFFGVPGIILGCCLSNLYRDVDLMYFIPKHLTKTAPLDTFVRQMLSVLKCVLITVPGCYLVPNASTWFEWMLQAIALCVLGLGACLLVSRLWEWGEICGLVKRASGLLQRKRTKA